MSDGADALRSLRELIYGSQQDNGDGDDENDNNNNDDDDDKNNNNNNENPSTNRQDGNITKGRGTKRSFSDDDEDYDDEARGNKSQRTGNSQRTGTQRSSMSSRMDNNNDSRPIKKRKSIRFVLDSDQELSDADRDDDYVQEEEEGSDTNDDDDDDGPEVPGGAANPMKKRQEARLDALYTHTPAAINLRHINSSKVIGSSNRSLLTTAPTTATSTTASSARARAKAAATVSIPSADLLHAPPPGRVPRPPKPMYKNEGRPVREPDKSHMATAEQIAERQRKKDLKLEWKGVRQQWKKRKYDLRGEQDVGGAIQYAARQAAGGKRKQAPKANTADSIQSAAGVGDTSSGKAQAAAAGNDDYADTSDEEQGNILNRLMQSSQLAHEERAKAAPQGNVNDGKPDLRPYAERLEAWELGRSAPRPQDLEFNYTEYRKQPAQFYPGQHVPPIKRGNVRRKQLEPLNDAGVSLAGLTGKKLKTTSMECFPLSHEQYVTGRFTHSRQLLAVAARHIVGAAGKCVQGDNAALENRMLRAIWNRDLAECHRLRLLLSQAGEHGQNLHVFLQHEWKNRHTAAERLGVLADLQTTGPASLTGFTLLPQTVYNAGRKDRVRLVQECSLGSFTWQPEALVDGKKPGKAKITNRGSCADDITPATGYLPVSGTIPPVPSFPLDETGIIFGPKDKYTHVWYNGPVDGCVYVLTLSSLLSRLATAHMEGDDAVEEKLQEQIESMVEQTVQLNRSDYYKRLYYRKQSVSELPLASYYKALMGYCNLMANGYPQKSVVAGKDAGDDNDSDGSDDEKDQAGQAAIHIVAERMFDFCQPLIDHNGLQLFSRLHVTFGLLRISKILPESAVDILSQPFGDHHCRTPFEIISCLLEHLENNYLLVDNLSSPAGVDESSEIHVGELEYAFHQASEIFGRCVQRDPTEVDYHAWYTGTLAGSLLLCSGNRIGSGARRYPSSYVYRKERQSLMLLEGGSSPSKSHEVRRMLPKFQELRRETAQAFQLLTHLEKHQQASRTHLSVSSFLEWRQVVALIVGPIKGKRNPYRAIRRFHEDTVVKWTLQERSAISLEFLQRCESSLDDRLGGYAASLESDPCELNHWRALVSELGPVSSVVSKESAAKCEDCEECERLHDGLNVPHASLQRRKEKGSWWGTNRRDWWDSHLLHLSGSDPSKTVADWPIICKALKKKMSDLPRDESSYGRLDDVDDGDNDDDDGDGAPRSTRSLSSLQWLNDVIDAPVSRADSQAEKEPPVALRNQTHDEQLSKTFLEVCELAKSRQGRDEHTCVTLLDTNANSSPAEAATEIMFCKVLIACHLYGVMHPIVQMGVRTLAVECWDRMNQRVRPDEHCLAVRCLAWLNGSVVGLNIFVILGDAIMP
jgi:hypothetical protein